MKNRSIIVFDGKSWFVRRLAISEHDINRDYMVYHCDKPLGGPYKQLADIPMVKRALTRRPSPRGGK